MNDRRSDVDDDEWHEHDADEPYLQPRCVHCKREHYVMSIVGVSTGRLGCSWCGRLSPRFTSWREWRAAYDRPTNYGDNDDDRH
jgi:hypothetical protein